jgi:predicted amidophosphoribosyltransferase
MSAIPSLPRHPGTCRSCARDTERYPGLTARDERSGDTAKVCGECLRDRPTLALNALAAWLKARSLGAQVKS